MNGESITGKSSDNFVDIIYENIEKTIIEEPTKKVPVKPLGPKYKKGFTRPVVTAFSAVALLLIIVFAVLIGCGVNAAVYLLVISIMATLILCAFSNGGIIFLLINLCCFSKIKRKREQEMQQYKSDLAKYIADMETAQIEYNNSLQEYEQQVASAEKEYADKCRKLHESVIVEIQNYIAICKDYFARKKKAEAEFEKKKAVIKAKYDAIASKIKSYPDTMPPKFLKVPELDNASCYTLEEIKSELKAYIDILESGRADTIKEATNCYIADKQAEEQRRILEQQAEDARRREEERNRILAEQAEDQRRHNEERRRFNEQQAEEQRRFNERQAEEQRRRDEEQRRQTEKQQELLERQACAAAYCVSCSRQGRSFCYRANGNGGCMHYEPKR